MLLAQTVCIFTTLVLNNRILSALGNPTDWRTIEALAEEHPYVVAILSLSKDYVCTGTIINKRTVLTSGGCVNLEPSYVAVATAIFNSKINRNSIFKVALTKLHGDYIFDLQETDFSVNKMHSNIGLVFTIQSVLNIFVENAIIGLYYASELNDKKLIMVGYGNIKASEIVVLHQQAYHQIACKNPKWYYCVCGIEYSNVTYEEPFGEGAPVLYNNIVIGISARLSGTLTLNRNIYYNIFTVIGPYSTWIEKSKLDTIVEFKDRQKNNIGQLEIYQKYHMTVLMIIFEFIK